MKLSTTFLLIFFLTLSYNQLHSQAYTLDKDKSGQISWTGYGEVGGYAQTGTLNVEAASLDWDVEQKTSLKNSTNTYYYSNLTESQCRRYRVPY
ncbi:MAG: hypothetical protein AAFS00_15355 [Bacteroidota bacterium]